MENETPLESSEINPDELEVELQTTTEVEVEEDFSEQTSIYRKKITKRLLIVFISTLFIIFTRMFPKYSDFDVIMKSDLFLALFTLTIVMSITIYLFLEKTKNNIKSIEMNKIHNRILDVYDLFSIVPIFIAVVTVLNAFVISPATVDGQSMEPNFYDEDDVIIEHISFNIDVLDIVIIKVSDGEYYIKRVIGLPGDTVVIDNNSIYINGTLLDQSFIEDANGSMLSTTYCNANHELNCTFNVPDGSYFVLGDNRENSTDSRSTSLGFVSEDKIYGEVVYKFDNILRNLFK